MNNFNNCTIGSWITIAHSSIVEVMADSGFDWLCIDLEHTTIDYSEMLNLIIAIQGKGLKAYVRVGENNPLIIKRVLDAGPDGIIVPSVNSSQEALKALNAVKYPPIGTRGVGLARAQGYGFSFDKYKNETLNNIKLIVQIEHFKAIEELDLILNLEGIDGTFIGPYDLSGSIGKPGCWDDPEVIDLIKRYENIAKRYDKLIGFHIVPPDFNLVNDKINNGYNFIAFSFDLNFLGQMIRNQLKLRKT
jgi:2-keto-3-deoxy-L-rhamnonate aldolase RhmA